MPAPPSAYESEYVSEGFLQNTPVCANRNATYGLPFQQWAGQRCPPLSLNYSIPKEFTKYAKSLKFYKNVLVFQAARQGCRDCIAVPSSLMLWIAAWTGCMVFTCWLVS